MKKTILRYGLYGIATIGLLSLLIWALVDVVDNTTGEVIGYSSMVVSLLFVYFGIKHFRDKENNGMVSFAKALLIGILISLMVAVAFGILDLIYVKFVNPDFMNDYYAGMLEQAESLPPEEFEIRKAELQSEKQMFLNPYLHFFIMSMMVFVIGFIISLLSALMLQRKK